MTGDRMRHHLVRLVTAGGAVVMLAGAAWWASAAPTARLSATRAPLTTGTTAQAKAAAARADAARELKVFLHRGRPGPGLPASGHSSRTATGTGVIRYWNWSGYADDNTSGNTYTKVSGSWTQPTVTCGAEGQIAVFWVGLDGFNNGTVEQDGTYAQCFEGTAYYYTWWEMYPTNQIQIVAANSPGDVIHASVAFSSGKFKLALTDATTTSASFTTTQTCGAGLTCARASAEWIAERPGESTGLYPLALFSPWKLTKATVTSGTTTGVISTFPDDIIHMVDTFNGYDLATPGTLGATGKSFTITSHVPY
jgi:hypothetical protein